MANPPPYSKPTYGGSKDEQPEPHFLDACFLCKTPIPSTANIYMYQGNLPFCTPRCRDNQIAMDEPSDVEDRISSFSLVARNFTKPETAMGSRPIFTIGGDSEDKHREPQLPEACYLCKTPLGPNRDTHVSQGNRRFCSECCKKKENTDEAKEGDSETSSATTDPTKPETDNNGS